MVLRMEKFWAVLLTWNGRRVFWGGRRPKLDDLI